MTSNKSRLWFAGVFILFACRGIMMSTWSNQGPAIKGFLGLTNSAMGLYQMVISIGSILGVVFAGRLLHRLGSRYLALITYAIMAVSLIGLAFAVTAHDILWACIFTALIGAPFGAADFLNNFEAGEIDRQSGRNRVPMLHFGYSGAVLLGAALTSILIGAKISLNADFALIGIIVAVGAIIESYMVPKENGKIEDHSDDGDASTMTIREVLADVRNRKIVTIAFAFVVAEGSAVLWVPITLTGDGMSRSAAAAALTVFAAGMAISRVLGGRIADRFGRQRIIQVLAITAILGIAVFMATPVIHLPILGIALWGVGDSIGIAMAVSAISESRKGQHAKQTLLWLVVYFGNFTVGPVLGFISSFAGNYASFLFPVAALAVAFTFSRSVKSALQKA